MLQDARTNKVDKATTVVITIMSNNTTTAAPAAAAAVEPEVIAPTAVAEVDPTAPEAAPNVAKVSFFDQFADNGDTVEKTREDIVAELLLRPNVKKMAGLHIRNVVTNTTKDVPFLTFVLKEFIIGDTRSASTDAFGIPEIVLGRTHNAVVSAYAVSAVMKDNPKTAVFAQRVAEGSDVANILFAGGTIDLLLEYVAAGEEYSNPFAATATPTIFDRDHVIVHVLAIKLGETGQDAYAAMLARI